MSRVMDIVGDIGKIALVGDIVPKNWFKHVLTPAGKPDSIGVLILAEIVYWYRPTEIRDEYSGKVVGIKKKFKSDKLQRSYQQLMDMFGFSKDQIRDAINRLIASGLITVEFRTLVVAGVALHNVMFVEPVAERVKEITFSGIAILDDTVEEKVQPSEISDHPPVNFPIPPSKFPDTNTEINTENSTESVADSLCSSSITEKADALPVADEITSLDKGSKYIKPQQPTLALDKVVDLATQKSRESRDKRLQKPRKAIQNSNTMILYFSECFKEEFGCSAPLTLAKDRALMKKMIENSGYAEVEDMIGWLFRNWKRFSKECKITGVPTIGMFFGYRGYLQGRTLEVAKEAVASAKGEESVWGI